MPFDGSTGVVSALLTACFEEGLMLHSTGSDPAKLRFLLPLNTTDEELEAGLTMLEKALRRIAEERDLPC
jgi:diaminobutyrate-2-oxoglutarate transaminase